MPADMSRLLPPLAIAVVLLAGAGAVAHYYAAAHRLAEIEQLESELARQTQIAHILDHLQQRVDELDTERSRYRSRLPQRLDVGTLLQRLGNQLDDQPVRRRQLTTDRTDELDRFTRLPVTIQFVADFSTLWQTLNALEDYEELLRPRRLVLERDPGDAALSARIELAAFAADPDDLPEAPTNR